MGINTNLNIAPYFDDYEEQKQYVRVLFKPARGVQARELTQLQTMLQSQIERFGSNIYKEGSIIEGVNPTTDGGVSYVKVNDQSGVDDMSAFISTEENPIFARGLGSGLYAKVIAASNGYQTRDPDLKTLYIKYLKSNIVNQNQGELKQFLSGELIRIEDADGNEIETLTTASVEGHAGSSYAVSVTDGIVYQRGHFNYVQPQLIIVEKYNNNPDGISVGFDVEELLVDAAMDDSLLDNAQGFNNQNAPGADRLKLTPILKAYTTEERPSEFFTLIRLEGGKPIYIRGDTQFNSIAKEMAKRTEDESGSYVVRGLNVTTEYDEDTGKLYAVVGAGKAYAFGYELNNLNNKRIEILPSTVVATKTRQSTGVNFGSYLEIDVSQSNSIIEKFNFTERYSLKKANQDTIGYCSVRNVEWINGQTKAKVYVYAVEKIAGQENEDIAFIAADTSSQPTPVIAGNIKQVNTAAALFDTGRMSMLAASGVVYVEKRRISVNVNQQSTGTVNIPVEINGETTITPLSRGIFGVSTTGEFVPVVEGGITQQTTNGNLSSLNVTFNRDGGGSGQDQTKIIEYIYYDATVSGVTHDVIQEVDVWVSTTFNKNTNFGSIGLPNCVFLKQVLDEDGIDITAKFRLVNNQKDGYYDISYLRLKQGETLPEIATTIKVNVIAFKRNFVGASKYLTANSYSGIENLSRYIQAFTAKNGRVYNPVNCFDFRPYAQPITNYSTNKNNPPVVPTSYSLALNPSIPIGNNTAILSDHKYYLARMDKLAIDKTQKFVIMQGQPADTPNQVVNDSVFGIADIFVPGKVISKSGVNSVRVKRNTVKNYTMRDIRALEQRLDIMFDVLSLSLLEQETKDLFIPDANGLNRFKNGILVDQFKDLNIADLLDTEWKAAIERGQRVLTPALTQFPVDLKLDPVTSTNVQPFDNVTTKALAETNLVAINQEYATNYRNLASNFYKYKGAMNMHPRFDAEYDVTSNPPVTIEIDLETPFLDLIDNIQQYVPLTNTVRTGTTQNGSARMEGNWRVTPMLDSFRKETLDSIGSNVKSDLGTYVTDFSIEPYVAAKNIQVYVTGLRPNTRHYFFFDGKPVSEHTAPGGWDADLSATTNIKSTDIYAVGNKGDAIFTDAFGRLAAVFSIPPRTFMVGTLELIVADADQFASIESAGTSIGKEFYRAYSFAVNTTTIGSDVREVDFFTDVDTWTENRDQRVFVPPPDNGGGDPLAQTFSVQPSQAEYASYMFVSKAEVWFKKKSPASRKNGVMVEIRETSNGYPAAAVVPFGRKHIEWDQIQVSDDASVSTTIVFDDPVKLEVGKDYCIVLIPDAIDPDYFIFTAVTGETAVDDDSKQVTSDWGQGVLFTSTNNKAWQSYQNEDLKFRIYKYAFSTEDSFVDLVPNNMEFFRLSGTVRNFINDEYAYCETASTYSGTLNTNKSITFPLSQDFGLVPGDLVIVKQGVNYHVTKVKTLVEGDNRVLTFVEPPILDAGPVTVVHGIGGKVTYFNPSKPTYLHIKESSVRVFENNQPSGPQWTFNTAGDESIGQWWGATNDGTQIIKGSQSGATAYLESIYNAPCSYFQPFIMQQNTLRTRTELSLYKGPANVDPTSDLDAYGQPGDQIGLFSNSYLLGEGRYIPSWSWINRNPNDTDRFRFRLQMSNNDFRFVTPVVDNYLSTIQAYEYYISEEEVTTSKYISKEVVLQPDYNATGLKVIMGAFRPAGTIIDVYARFVYPYNVEQYSEWVKLRNNSSDLYSTSANIYDYREFQYDLLDETKADGITPNEYTSFQLKIVLRHATAQELNELDILSDIEQGPNLFPHVYDYRAIALT